MSAELLAEIEPLIGKPSPPITTLIELGAVRRFAEAVGEPLLLEDDGAPRVLPTFFEVIPYNRPPFPGDADRHLINFGNTFTITRLPVVGDAITTRAAVTRASRRGPLVSVDLECRYFDASEALIGVGTVSWLIDVDGVLADGSVGSPADRVSVDPASTSAWDAVDVSKLKPGDALPVLAKTPLTTAQFVRYAAASGDFNPVHYDKDYAQRAGFPHVIAPGLLKMAFFGQHVTLWAGRWGQVRRIEAKYVGIDVPGAELTSVGTITEATVAEGRPTLTVALSLCDRQGDVRTAGKATVEVKDAFRDEAIRGWHVQPPDAP